MNARFLDPDEWGRAHAPGLDDLLLIAEPQNIAIVVVEDDAKEIIASVAVLKVTHFEGLWIKPSERGNAGVFRALIRQAYALPKLQNESFVLATPDVDDVRMASICARLGGKRLPQRMYALPVQIGA